VLLTTVPLIVYAPLRCAWIVTKGTSPGFCATTS